MSGSKKHLINLTYKENLKTIILALYYKISKSRLAKDSFSYTIYNIIEKAIPFLILPIITRTLSKEDVGLYILFQALIEVLIPIMTLKCRFHQFIKFL